MAPNNLPNPSDDAKELSNQLTEKIKKHLNRHQNLSFANFMHLALYTPELGYYNNPLMKIGRDGDFITAPEVSPLFSQSLANQVAEGLAELNDKNILEFGAGRGAMALDLILALYNNQIEFENYYILEVSGHLKLRQEETLQALPPELLAKVTWLNSLPEKPLEAIILANEVLDAMPVEVLKLEPEEASQAFVIWDEETNKFAWKYQPILDKNLLKIANQLMHQLGEPDKKGYITEVNLNLDPWLNSLSQILAKGMVLLIDYGYPRREYYQQARTMGTLRCHYQHRAHNNPFFYPGLQDITAHVDFTAVAEAGFNANFKISGYTTQAHFLMNCGILDLANKPDLELVEQLKLAQQIKTLTLPNEMGEAFKVIALTKKIDKPLLGFAMHDLRHYL